MNFSPFGFGSPFVIDWSGPATGLPAPFDNAENWTSVDLGVPDVAVREGIDNRARGAPFRFLQQPAWRPMIPATAADPKKTLF